MAPARRARWGRMIATSFPIHRRGGYQPPAYLAIVTRLRPTHLACDSAWLAVCERFRRTHQLPFPRRGRCPHRPAGLRRLSTFAERTRPKPPLCKGIWRAAPEGLTIPQSRFASQLRVAAKPSRPVLPSSKASGCWAAVVASSATGGAPLRAPYTWEPWARRYKRPRATTSPFVRGRFAARTRTARPYGENGEIMQKSCRVQHLSHVPGQFVRPLRKVL